MKKPKVAFVVYGVHKDGLEDPMGTPFLDESLDLFKPGNDALFSGRATGGLSRGGVDAQFSQ
jgi:hypothetical protein